MILRNLGAAGTPVCAASRKRLTSAHAPLVRNDEESASSVSAGALAGAALALLAAAAPATDTRRATDMAQL